MLDFLKGFFSDAGTIATRVVFVVIATVAFYLFFYYAKKRNLHLYTVVVVSVLVVLFVLSFFVSGDELAFYLYFALGALAILGLILFTQEINRHMFRASLKRKTQRDAFANHYDSEDLSKSVNEIVRACLHLSKTDTGALIVIADHISDEISDSGVHIDSEITAELLETVFFPKTALHDGAVIITGNKVVSAGCYLPLTQAQNLPREFGTRHRAAIGVSAAFPDATAIVVSEETGIISATHDNKIKRYLDTKQLQAILECAFNLADESAEERIWGE